MNDYEKQQVTMSAGNRAMAAGLGCQTVGASSMPRIAVELDINASRIDVLADGLERLCRKLTPVMTANPLDFGKSKAQTDVPVPVPESSEISRAISYRTDRINDQIHLVQAMLEQLEV